MIPGWKEETEGEYLQLLRETSRVTPRDFAVRLGVSECCAIYWLTELAKEGRVRILTVELVKDGDVPCARESFVGCQRKASCPALSGAEALGESA